MKKNAPSTFDWIAMVEGVNVSVVELLKVILQVAGESKIEVMGSCSRLLAAYAAARHAGQNHLAATNGLRGLVKVVAK